MNNLARGLNQASADHDQSPILEAVHLRKMFPLHSLNLFGSRQVVHAVEDASLTLYPGRATALVGESGSGKTTVARMLAGLYSPTSGTVRFRGDPAKLSDRSYLRTYRRHVQLILQDPFSSLNPVHNVRYHLGRPLHIFNHVHNNAQMTEQILPLLDRVNLCPAEQFIQKYPHQLSGGQRQRVAIARALAVQPEVLLAFLFITHDISSARYFAEDTLVMYSGQMVEGGPSDEVIQRPMHPYMACH